MPYSRVLQLWQHSDAFVEVFVRSLQESPFEAFRWETPPISLESRSCNFEFVLINAPEFVQRKIDSVSFADHFNSAGSGAEAIAFRNLRGDARLVVPAPLVHVDAYGHLASFLRKAAKDQIRELWRCVGR
ncbi:MAG: hypothetical protein KDA91_20655 [Planctomycetaceae bacterium]|nr:hypothetical protein [Planctomycetaceae bacterium]